MTSIATRSLFPICCDLEQPQCEQRAALLPQRSPRGLVAKLDGGRVVRHLT